jgi:hypothetical protein
MFFDMGLNTSGSTAFFRRDTPMCRERERFGEFLSDEAKFLIRVIVHVLVSIILVVAAMFVGSDHAAPKDETPKCKCSQPYLIPPKTPRKTRR